MNRRQFTQSLGALFASPALPGRALAGVSATQVASSDLYSWSAMIARVHGNCSPAMLERMLHVDAAHAAALVNKLAANGLIGRANAMGLRRANALLPPQTDMPTTEAPRPFSTADGQRPPGVHGRLRADVDPDQNPEAEPEDRAPDAPEREAHAEDQGANI